VTWTCRRLLDGGTDVGHLDVAEDEFVGDDLPAIPGHGNFGVRVAKKRDRKRVQRGSRERGTEAGMLAAWRMTSSGSVSRPIREEASRASPLVFLRWRGE
jgi:hypothetical protein